MLDEFNFDILEDPEFKEDSVREEIIVPIIKELGYSSSGKNRIVRSRRLKHPFVSIGSGRLKVSIIPDYLFIVGKKPFLILDAKSPTENINKTKHCEQAYSYAIHPEIRAKYYALCNGKEFLLYYISKFEPLLYFKIKDIDEHLPTLKKLLHPEILATPEVIDYKPDCGMYLLKLGKKPGFLFILHMIHTNIMTMISNNKYTTSTVINFEDQEFLATFDFDHSAFQQLLNILPESQTAKIRTALEQQPFQIHTETEEFLFGIVSKLGNVMHENNEEQYVPFIVKEFIPYLTKC